MGASIINITRVYMHQKIIESMVISWKNTSEPIGLLINSLPNDKILDWSKLKALADDKIKVQLNLC